MDGRAEKKQALRQRLRAIRRALPPEERAAAERVVTERVLALIAARQSKRLLLYASMPEELSTDRIGLELLAAGDCALYYPRVEGTALSFYQVTELGALRAGYRGIREPAGEAPRYEADSAGDIILVPGCAFTERGDRLGYGGGYYDRFLAAHPALYKLGLAYAAQLCAALPVDPCDIRVDRVVTEIQHSYAKKLRGKTIEKVL